MNQEIESKADGIKFIEEIRRGRISRLFKGELNGKDVIVKEIIWRDADKLKKACVERMNSLFVIDLTVQSHNLDLTKSLLRAKLKITSHKHNVSHNVLLKDEFD